MRKFRTSYLYLWALVVLGAASFVVPTTAHAQTDEIQVYDAEIADVGKFNLMMHTNYTPDGQKTPAYPGAIIANQSVNGALEWAYGVTPWFEQGLYLPVYTLYSEGRGGSINGFKIRELFVVPHAAERTFFYGLNFEFSVNYPYWEDRTITQEFRPIFGLHLHQWDLIVNPILDTNWTGGFGNLRFNPAMRVAYNLNKSWAVAVEQYMGLGPLEDLYSPQNQFQETWAVFDHPNKFLNIEAGIGFGETAASDKVTIKLMLSRDLN